MGMSFYRGKTVEYISDDDRIHPETEVRYIDQNRNECKINVKKLLEKARKCVKKKELMDLLIRDIEGEGLAIGFPVIVALNDIAEELGEFEAMEIIQ